jgi:xanthine dehydrogenase accessory factor
MRDVLDQIVKQREAGNPAVLVMVVDGEGTGVSSLGSKMAVWENGQVYGSLGGGYLEVQATQKALEVFKDRKNAIKKINSVPTVGADLPSTMMKNHDSEVKVYFEYIGVQQKIYVFGAGHIGQALAYHLAPMDYEVNVFDSRKEVLDGIEEKVNKFKIDYDLDIKDMNIRQDDMIIIATHSQTHDYAIFKSLLGRKYRIKYVGLVASIKKVEEYKAQITEELGLDIDLTCLYSPVGLDIGGETPHELAVSITAQIQAVRHGKFSECLDLL